MCRIYLRRTPEVVLGIMNDRPARIPRAGYISDYFVCVRARNESISVNKMVSVSATCVLSLDSDSSDAFSTAACLSQLSEASTTHQVAVTNPLKLEAMPRVIVRNFSALKTATRFPN